MHALVNQALWRRAWLQHLAIGSVLVALLAAGQFASGAYQSDFSAGSDEPAHVVSSLMVREYLAHHLFENPLRFAENYYIHFPKVAIGHWPPLFYCAEAVWTLALGASRATLLLLILLFDTLLALCVYRVVHDCAGAIPAFLAGLAMIAPPFLREAAFTVEPDMMLALLAFLAAMVYGKRFEAKRPAFSLLFIILCAACVLTHGRGVAVVLMPLVAILLTNPSVISVTRWLLIVAAFGAAVGLAILIGQSHTISIVTVFENAALFPWHLGKAMSWPVFLVAAVGAWWSVRNRVYPLVVMTSLVLSLWSLLIFLNSGVDSRYLIMIAPAIAVLFGTGLQVLWTFAASMRTLRAIAAVGLSAVTLVSWSRSVHKPDLGFHNFVSQGLMAAPESRISLVAGGSVFEGAYIAETALHDLTPYHVTLRASKALASSTWSQLNYHLRMSGPREVANYLDAAHAGLVVVQRGYARPHMPQLLDAIASERDQWTDIPGPAQAQVFRRTGPFPPGEPVIRIDMRDKLGRDLVLDE
jgi:hypothetical protein